MKKSLVILLMSLITLAAYSQDYKDSDYYYYDGLENRNDMGISTDQKSKIISIKKSIGRRHAAIGKDRSLRGYEKGQAHRDLNKKVRKEIYDVLNSNQRDDWEKKSDKDKDSDDKDYGKWSKKYDDIEKKIDALEDDIDDMEDAYDAKIKAVERDGSLSKAERKFKKQSLKDQFKAEKKKMKREKQALKDSRYY